MQIAGFMSLMKSYLLLLFALILTGCGVVSGNVYYDLDGDGRRGDIEPVASSFPIEITYNGQFLAAGLTDLKGNFTAKGRGSGSYCLKLVDKKAKVRDYAVSVAKELPPVIPATTSTTSSGTSSTVTTSNNTTEDKKKDKVETKTESKPAGVDYSTQYPQEGKWVSDNEFCQSSNSSSVVMRGLGLKVNYDVSEDEVLTPDKKELRAGDVYYLKIKHSVYCELKPLKVPEYFDLTFALQDEDVWITTSGYLVWGEKPPKSTDDFVVRTARVKVTPPKGTLDVILKPEQECPDGDHDLPQVTLSLVGEYKVKLTQEMDATPRSGQRLNLIITATNESGLDLKGAEIVIGIPIEITVERWDRENGCRFAGDKVICPVDLTVGNTLKRIVGVKLPDNLAAHFVFSTKLIHADLSLPIHADDITFNLNK